MKNTFIYVSICMLFFCTKAITSTAQSETEMKAWMEYMTPGDMHKLLAQQEGEWTTESKMWMVDPMTGKECAIRETLKMVDNDTHVMTMYNAVGGAPEFKTMEMTFKRKK